MTATPEAAASALANAIAQQDTRIAFALVVAGAAWTRGIQPLFELAVKRGQGLVVTGPATIVGVRASVPCGLTRPNRPLAKAILLAARDDAGAWQLAGVESEAAMVHAWLHGYISGGMTYKDLPVSALGVAIAARVVAATEQGGDIAAALGDDSASGVMASAMLSSALVGRTKRVSPLPSREHAQLGRIAVGFELSHLASHGSEEIWVVLEDRGDGVRALGSLSYMSLSPLLADHGGGWPTPVSRRTPVPTVAPLLFGDAFERAVLSAAASASAFTSDADDLFARAVQGNDPAPPVAVPGNSPASPWAALTEELAGMVAARHADQEDGVRSIGDRPDPVVTTDELVQRVRAAIGAYLQPFAEGRPVAGSQDLVREHAQGVVGAAFQAIVPLLRAALTAAPPE